MIKCLWSEIFVGKSRLQFSLPSLIWVISRFEYTNGLDRNKCFFAYIHAFFFPCILCKSIWSCYRQSSSSALSITNIVFNFFQRHRKVLIIKKNDQHREIVDKSGLQFGLPTESFQSSAGNKDCIHFFQWTLEVSENIQMISIVDKSRYSFHYRQSSFEARSVTIL